MVKVATFKLAPTTGVISDSRANVGMIKVSEVNRIVYTGYLEVDLCARNVSDLGERKWQMQEHLNTPAPPNLRDEIPSHQPKTFRVLVASLPGGGA